MGTHNPADHAYNSYWKLNYSSKTSGLIPMLLNPPSWKRFCMVIIRLRSENIATQKSAHEAAFAFPKGDILSE